MAKRLALMVAMVIAGVVCGAVSGDVTAILDGPLYVTFVTALLAIGLYGSTYGIDLEHLRRDGRTVVLATTVGVGAKAVLIAAVMLAVFRDPAYLVLGIAVAQIDPLSVAALSGSSRLSRRGRGLLLAWASFDDPVTALLTVYAAALAASLLGRGTTAGLGSGGPAGLAVDLAGNAVLAAVAIRLYRLIGRRAPRYDFPAACAVLVAVFAVGIWQGWVLAVALAGLWIRPEPPGRPDAVQRLLDRAVGAAFLLASLLLGAVLSLGVSPLPGLVLGMAAFAAHALVSLPLTRGQDAGDRMPLALAQQNGITAIILALVLEPVFGGTVAVVAPAILTINVLHLVGNAWASRAPVPAGPRVRDGAPPDASSAAPPALGEEPAHPVAQIPQERVHVRPREQHPLSGPAGRLAPGRDLGDHVGE
nr:cation:proton antiporter [Actinomadura fibrosa]